jgi:hypothetical protein
MVKAHTGSPYLEVVDAPRQMKGAGAPRQTVFGVLGHTKEDPKMRSLGGLVQHATGHHEKKGEVQHHPRAFHTERNITGPAAKTKIPGAHYGAVPYAGVYMSHLGSAL